jgi:hypothetical protein
MASLLIKFRDDAKILSELFQVKGKCANIKNRPLYDPFMRVALQLLALSFLVCVDSSCKTQPTGEGYVSEKTPIEIQGGKPVTIEIYSLSGNGENQVGVRCSPEAWSSLTNSTESITVRLKSSDKRSTQIGGISPGGGRLWPVESFHYLFYISGEYHTKASVEITFPNAPLGVTPAEIIVCKTPADTGP